eukprot:15044423-Heterocapsa_arctica.AAC.1
MRNGGFGMRPQKNTSRKKNEQQVNIIMAEADLFNMSKPQSLHHKTERTDQQSQLNSEHNKPCSVY